MTENFLKKGYTAEQAKLTVVWENPQCESAVDLDVPISDILRCSMYAHGYGSRDMARSLLNTLPAGARDNVFKADYSEAEKSCPQKIKIGRVLKRACEDLG
jgi:hypothetical protein